MESSRKERAVSLKVKDTEIEKCVGGFEFYATAVEVGAFRAVEVRAIDRGFIVAPDHL